MAEIVTVYAVFAHREDAERVAAALVEERLAACANILGPCRSIYRWQGEVERADEVPALFKTAADRAPALLARLAELHSFEVPAAVVWPVADALAPYGAWVADNTAVS